MVDVVPRLGGQAGIEAGGGVMQNVSHAVMAQRSEAPDSLDFFPTPPWATRALINHILAPLDIAVPAEIVAEPAAGKGHMVRPLAEFFAEVRAADIMDYGVGYPVFDFLLSDSLLYVDTWPFGKVDWIITNPPFNRLTEFVETAAAHAQVGVAMFARIQALESVERYERIYLRWFERVIWAQFVERVPLAKNRVNPKGSTATAYGWLIITKQRNWPHPYVQTWPPGRTPQLILIPKCRKELERPEDYEAAE